MLRLILSFNYVDASQSSTTLLRGLNQRRASTTKLDALPNVPPSSMWRSPPDNLPLGDVNYNTGGDGGNQDGGILPSVERCSPGG